MFMWPISFSSGITFIPVNIKYVLIYQKFWAEKKPSRKLDTMKTFLYQESTPIAESKKVCLYQLCFLKHWIHLAPISRFSDDKRNIKVYYFSVLIFEAQQVKVLQEKYWVLIIRLVNLREAKLSKHTKALVKKKSVWNWPRFLKMLFLCKRPLSPL